MDGGGTPFDTARDTIAGLELFGRFYVRAIGWCDADGDGMTSDTGVSHGRPGCSTFSRVGRGRRG